MKIATSRFGQLDVEKHDIIKFKEGPLGFEDLKRFFIVDPGDQSLILWFQSVDSPEIAFPILEPKIFDPSCKIKLLPAELQSLEIESVAEASVYTILTIPKDISEMSANMKAPIVINNKTRFARQIVLQDNKLEVRKLMYKELKTYIVNYSSNDSNNNAASGTSSIAPDSKKRPPETQA